MATEKSRKTRFSELLIAVVLALALGDAAYADSIVEDGFESGTLRSSDPGFQWSATNNTFVVRDDGYITFGAGAGVEGPFAGRRWENGPGSKGRHALMFRYPAGKAWAEQRFTFSRGYPELWLSFWVRVPPNFQHPDSSPNNQKLLSVWMDGYSQKGDGSTVWLGFFHDGKGGSAFGASFSDGRFTASNAFEQVKPFISVPADRARWMQLVVHLKAESSPDAGDGVFQTWRRWSGESEFVQTQNLTNKHLRIPSGGPSGFAAGYLMGWANGAYSEETEFLIDDLRISTSSLLDVDITPNPPRPVAVN